VIDSADKKRFEETGLVRLDRINLWQSQLLIFFLKRSNIFIHQAFCPKLCFLVVMGTGWICFVSRLNWSSRQHK